MTIGERLPWPPANNAAPPDTSRVKLERDPEPLYIEWAWQPSVRVSLAAGISTSIPLRAVDSSSQFRFSVEALTHHLERGSCFANPRGRDQTRRRP